MSTKNTEIVIHPSEKKQTKFVFFECNWNYIKNNCKEIKSLITLEGISISFPRTLNHNNKTS